MGEVGYFLKNEIMMLVEEMQSERTSGLGLESNVLHYVQSLSLYKSSPQGEGLQHLSVSDCVTRFYTGKMNRLMRCSVVPATSVFGMLPVCTSGL